MNRLLSKITKINLCLIVMAQMLPAKLFASKAFPWQMNFQEAATPVAERIREFHDFLLILTIGIVIFVMGLMAYVMIKFHKSRNPVPSKTTHNTLIEVVWTLVPVIILVVIVFPSLKLMYFMDKTEDAEMTVKVVSHQWYWSYEYPDHDNIAFDSLMLKENELKPGQPRLLEVDNRLVVPVGTNIRVLLTSADVLHSWAVPSMGVKTDTVPGRLNETWIKVTKEGVYYGQCSELCGRDHGFMPIAVEVVSKDKFAQWVEDAKVKFAANNHAEKTIQIALAR